MVENTLPAVEPLAVSDKCTLVLEKLADGKIRVTSTSLVEDKVILAGQVLEARSLDGRIRLARKERLPDAGDPPRVPSDYDPYQTDDDLLVEQDVANVAA
jgi:hypothetical protein